MLLDQSLVSNGVHPVEMIGDRQCHSSPWLDANNIDGVRVIDGHVVQSAFNMILPMCWLEAIRLCAEAASASA
jgi:hypothetical protein